MESTASVLSLSGTLLEWTEASPTLHFNCALENIIPIRGNSPFPSQKHLALCFYPRRGWGLPSAVMGRLQGLQHSLFVTAITVDGPEYWLLLLCPPSTDSWTLYPLRPGSSGPSINIWPNIHLCNRLFRIGEEPTSVAERAQSPPCVGWILPLEPTPGKNSTTWVNGLGVQIKACKKHKNKTVICSYHM